MQVIKPIYEFILWDNCLNNCKFCWQKQQNNFSTDEMRKKSVDLVIEFINSDNFEFGSHVLLVGGEIFDVKNDDVCNKIKELICFIIENMNQSKIDLFYINTNLLNTNYDLLDFLLDKIKDNGLFNRLKFTTSYDKFGRFQTKEKETEWFRNVKSIKYKYNELNIVINTILTKQFCDFEIKNDKSFVSEMTNRGFYVNLLPYVDINSIYTVDRKTVFDVLLKTERHNRGYLKRYIDNFDLPQKKLIYRFKDTKLIFSSSEYSECGHGINFRRYSDKNTCFICDLKTAFNGIIYG